MGKDVRGLVYRLLSRQCKSCGQGHHFKTSASGLQTTDAIGLAKEFIPR